MDEEVSTVRLCELPAPPLLGTALGLLCVLAPAGGQALTRGSRSPFALQVRARNVMTLAAVEAAGRDAVARLADPACGGILSDYEDASGLTLRQRLDRLGHDRAGRLRVYLYDGANHRGCQSRHRLAIAEPGSPVVYVCPRFVEEQRQDPGSAPVVIIHELLHVLGLEETEHSSEAITRHVRRRCGCAVPAQKARREPRG